MTARQASANDYAQKGMQKVKAAEERIKLVKGIKFEQRSVQHAYKHRAKTFGTSANYNKANHAKFTAEIKGHMQNPNTQVIRGEYHKETATHFFNKGTGVNVVTKNGNFVTTNKPTPTQIKHLLETGSLGGGPK